MKTYIQNQLLNYYLLEVDKADSSFLYFTFESNEGLCFYSTQKHVEGDLKRLLEVYSPIEFTENLEELINHLRKTVNIKILEHKTIKDSAE